MASYGSLTVDGALGDWLASDRLDNSLNAIAGVEAYGRRVANTYVFAFKNDTAIGAGTTIWLNTDMNRATGLQVFGWAAGAEYAISIDAAGVATLTKYTAAGAPDAAFVPVVLDKALSSDGKTVEFAVAAASLGNATGPVEAYVLVNNNAPALPGNYGGVAYTVRAGVTPATVGAVSLDGALTEWTSLHSLETAANSVADYDIYGRVEANSFVLAFKAPVAIGPLTTIWLNTDQDPTTGYKIFGTDGGAEYAIEFDVAGNPALYSVNATSGALTLVGAVQASFSADRTIVELAFAKSAVGSPIELDLFADINNTAFTPDPFAKPQYEIVDTSQLAARTDLTKKVAIVYSETSANKYFSKTAYGQLFMNAQSQAAAAGVAYDVISENDLKDIGKLIKYDAIVFPSFANVKAADAQAIANTLELAVEQYKIGLIAAGNFMTSDENGAALPGNSYARLDALFGVTREAGGTATTDIALTAGDITHTTMEGYTAGEVIRNYGAVGWADFKATVANAVTTVKQAVDGVTYDAAIATTTGGRNVHFATESIAGDSNLLQNAIEWSVYGAGVRVGLQLSRFASITASRTDLDSSSYREDVAPTGQPGIYDVLLPILQQWKDTFNFVGSYYANIGDPNITNGSAPQSTNWAQSLNYYKTLILMGNEVGSHSTTHLVALTPAEDTNILTTGTGPGSFDYEFRLSRDILTQQIGSVIAGYRAAGAAVPGAPEQLATSLNIIQYYDYMSGGWSGVGGGYPGAFGYLTPDQQSKVYIAPNVKFDFTLVEFQNMGIEGAAAEWAKEVAEISAHGDVPIIVWPWHDYAAAEWLTPGETGSSKYLTELFTNFIAAAYNSGTEFVTLADLAKRIASQEKAGITFSQAGNVVTATVTSADAGKFALDLDGLGAQKIASVAGWYAYDDDSVFTDRDGGTYTITLGAAPADVTHITSLPMRAELLAVSGDGTNLSFSIIGEGKVVIDLKNIAGATLTVTGAKIVSQAGDIVTLDVGTGDNLIVNGSFELGTLSTVNNTVQYPTNGQLTGWTNGAATSIEVWRNFGGVVATNGNYLVELDNAAAVDTLYQNVQTTAGGLYTLSVDLRARVGNTDGVEVWWAGQRIATIAPSATAWTTYTYTVTGTGGSDRLEFRELAAQNNGSGALIDNVRLIGAGGQQHNVTVTLGVPLPNQAPTINSNGGGATAAISLAENLLAVTTVTASNPEVGQTVTYSIAGGADAAKFTINAATGALSFITAPDFETPTDSGANNVYDVIVKAADNLGAFDTQAIAVTVTNVNGTTQTGTSGNNTLNGGNENDTISGGAGNDIINGNGGPDVLNGDAGIDTINGGDGNDTINGGAGQDILNGGAGNDRITGGADLDVMTGGAGADTFVFTMVSDSGTNILTRDVITDFTRGQDKIDLSALDANTGLAGDQAFTFLATQGAAFTGTGVAQVRYYYVSLLGIQYTVIEGSTDGDRNPEFSIALAGHVALTASDFIL